MECVKGGIPYDIAKRMKLPLKCVKRWVINCSAKRKKGGGRKILDIGVEEILRIWICLYLFKFGKMPPQKNQLDYAHEITKVKGFSASKGWLDKYLNRNSFNLLTRHLLHLPTITFKDISSRIRVIGSIPSFFLRNDCIKDKSKSLSSDKKIKRAPIDKDKDEMVQHNGDDQILPFQNNTSSFSMKTINNGSKISFQI